MRILIASDAWYPQINGVVRTLERRRRRNSTGLGHEVEVLGPDRFPTVPMPSYPEVRIAVAPGIKLARLMDEFRPDAVHIPVEGPIGFAARRHCLRRGWPFTTSYHTRAGIYFEEKFGIPNDLVLSLQRWFHNAGNGFMVQTDSLERELRTKGFVNIRRWCRGVDTELFRPVEPPRGCSICRGRCSPMSGGSRPRRTSTTSSCSTCLAPSSSSATGHSWRATASAIRTWSSPAGRRVRS